MKRTQQRNKNKKTIINYTKNYQTNTDPVLAWLYVLDAWEGGLPSARYLGVMADAAEVAGAPAEYVHDIRTRPARNIGPGPAE
jgi:hypothetical protein